MAKHKLETCPDCGEQVSLDEKHDTYFCRTCNKWLEETCSDSSCQFCKDRPSTPKPAPSSG